MSLYYKFMISPVGRLTLWTSEKGLRAILWENDSPDRVKLPVGSEKNEHPILIQAEQELNEYFKGQRTVFSLPMDPQGTDFQHSVWSALRNIPYGKTASYGELAKQLGNPNASRAVGAANGKNPLSIIVPCHRVIGTQGNLTGFAGGLEAKKFLLSLEGSSYRH